MKKIGLTGGIGTGKTYISKIFESLGVPVFYADDEAKKLMENSNTLRNIIKKEFGEDLYSGQSMNKKKLASIIFSNIEKLEKLNLIIHPIIKESFRIWCSKQSSNYVIKEAAILFESNSYKELDDIICVAAPQNIRIRRVSERDNLNREEVINRIRNQMDQKKKEKMSDYIIVNDEKEMLLPQIINIHQKLLS